MKKILLILSLPLLMMSCDGLLETQVLDLKAVLRVQADEPYQTTESDGDFVESSVITPEDVRDDLEDVDLSSVSEVNISSINLNISENPGNEARYVLISGFFEDENTPRTEVFSEYLADLSAFGGSELNPVTGYELTGINLLSDKLFDILRNNDFGSFVLSVEGSSADANGNATGDAIFLEIELEIEAEAIFTEELDVPNLP
jgi:hypothetical protein